MKVIIMAGGAGSRLRPLTCDRPKPMVPVMNIPIMEHILALLKKHNLTEIGVTLQYQPEKIKEYFGDGSEFGVNMRYYVEETPLGTAGSVKNAQDFLDEPFLVISGDALTDFNLDKAISFHRQKAGIGTLVLTRVETPLEYGVVIINEQQKIERFLEKPGWSEVFSDTVNTGIYILEPEVLDYFDADVKFDFSKDLFPLLMERGKSLYGHVAEGYWCDIGDIKQFREAHIDVLQGKIVLQHKGTREIAKDVWAGKNTIIEDGAEVRGPVLLGDGTRIEKGAKVEEYSVLGNNVIVEEGASIKRSIIWPNSYIRRKSEVRGAVLCQSVKFNKGAAIYEEGVIGDNSIIEEYSTIKPGVKIWPDKRVESGSTIHNSVIWGTKIGKPLFGREGVTGVVNYELTPEMVTKLGAAYGSLLEKGSKIVVGSDGHKESRMLKDTLVSGLLSVGISVFDIGTVVAPVTRQSVQVLKKDGGIHVQTFSDDTDMVSIKFLDDKGLNITSGLERKLEQAFFREDFARLKGVDVAEKKDISGQEEHYLETLADSLESKPIKNKEFKIFWAYPSKQLHNLLMPFFRSLNCKVMTVNNAEEKRMDFKHLSQKASEGAHQVASLGADLGFLMDDNAEKLMLIDNRGRVVEDEDLTALISLMVFKTVRGGIMAVPVTAPAAIEELADRYYGEVLRTKTPPRFLMEGMLAAGEKSKWKSLQFLFFFDAMATIFKVMEFLSRENRSLAQVMDTIPNFNRQVKQTPCSWKDKGRVMRRLIEETRQEEVEMLDGVRINHDRGWSLVLPDADKPFYQVYSEGYTEEYAESLTDMYIDKINSIRDSE